MTGEFRTAKGWRIFIYIVSPLLIGLFLYIGFTSLGSGTSGLTVPIILMSISIGGTILFIYALIDTIKGRFVIGDNSLKLIGVLGTKTLAFNEIKGFRTDSNYIYVVSNHSDKNSFKISTYTEKTGQIVDWLGSNFTELDSYEAMVEEQQILSDNKFGINSQTREYRLNEAKRISRYVNIVGGLTCVWLWFYPRPYMLCLSVGMILPAIAFSSLFIYRGLIRFDERKNSAYPSIIYGFLAPSAALLIRAVMDYEILEYTNIWITIGISSVSLTGLFILGTKEIKFIKAVDYFSALSLAAMILCYSFGAYVISNCLFDKSEPEIFNAAVVDKEISSGKSTTYYLTLEPWGPRTETEKVSVTKDEYETTDKGDKVDIYLRPGLFKTPWFYIVTE